MARSRLGIRPFGPDDLNEARFTVSKSIMEPLTEANKRSPYLAVCRSPDLQLLTTILPRLLSPNHYWSMGRTVLRVYRVHGLVAELSILRWHSFIAQPAPCSRDRGRPNHVLLRLVSRRQIPVGSESKYHTQG